MGTLKLIIRCNSMSSSTCDSDGFVTVSKRKSAKFSKLPPGQQISIQNTSEIDSASLVRNISNAKEDILISDYFKNCLSLLNRVLGTINKQITNIVCFGIGSISSSKISQYQLALLLNLSAKLKCLTQYSVKPTKKFSQIGNSFCQLRIVKGKKSKTTVMLHFSFFLIVQEN